MLYYLFEFLEKQYQFPGASLFGFLTFRASLAIITSLLIATVFGKKIIEYLQLKQIGETVRDLGLAGQKQKAGTPTMGGALIILSLTISTIIWARLDNNYIWLVLFVSISFGAIGWLDDYKKLVCAIDLS